MQNNVELPVLVLGSAHEEEGKMTKSNSIILNGNNHQKMTGSGGDLSPSSRAPNVLLTDNDGSATADIVPETTIAEKAPQQQAAAEDDEEEEKHQVHINDWHVNSQKKKKWFLGIQQKQFPDNYVYTTKVGLIHWI